MQDEAWKQFRISRGERVKQMTSEEHEEWEDAKSRGIVGAMQNFSASGPSAGPEKERVKKWEAARLRIVGLQKKISCLQELIDDATDTDELLFFKSKKRVLEEELQLAYQTPHPEEKPGAFDEPEE